MKRTWKLDYATRQTIYEQYVQGMSKNQIAKNHNLTWSTVNSIINNKGKCKRPLVETNLSWALTNIVNVNPNLYCYVLGMYLGDGYINEMRRKGVYRIRISLDNKYPQIIEECYNAMKRLFSQNKIFVRRYASLSEVSCYSKIMPIIFPQHGKGLKCDRDVSLKDWQIGYVKQYPKEFLKGLIKSDGCRYVINSKHKNIIYRQQAYNFTNTSKDIVDAFKWCCDILGVHYTVYTKPRKEPHHHDIFCVTIAKKKDVDFLNTFMDLNVTVQD